MNTNVNQKAIRDAMISYCEVKEISLNEFSKQIGISNATISNIKNGKWANIDNKIFRKIDVVVAGTDFSEVLTTRDFKMVETVCNAAQKNKKMIGLIADTGMGKTTGLKSYSYRSNVFYVYVDSTITPRIFLRQLLKDFAISFEGNLYEMQQKVIEKLNTIESPLIILDECAKLNDKMLLTIHSIRDQALKNCGFVLAGMPDFKHKLVKNANKQKTGFSEFLRRINMWHELEGLTIGEINGILSTYGINDQIEQKSFRQYRRFGDLKNEIDNYILTTNNN
jgi:DNA transposition AAA+ family ATPase